MSRRLYSTLICLFVLCALVATVAGVGHASTGKNGFLSLSAGYRVDELDWNIAGDFSGNNPNILSELTWDDLQILQFAAESEVVRSWRERIDTVFSGRAAYGFILAGDNQDSDYAGDNRTLEWSRSNNDAGDGHVLDLSGGIGVRFHLPDRRWSLTPQLGYAYFEQDLVMQDGVQTVSDITNAPPGFIPLPLGPFPGLNSSYYAQWDGPWIGLQVAHVNNERLAWDMSLRWYQVDYYAEADWNLRTDLEHPVSFEHDASGDGLSLNIGVDAPIGGRWDAGLDFDYIDLQTDTGLDIVYLDTGAVAGTRLNEVNWKSWALSLALKYHF